MSPTTTPSMDSSACGHCGYDLRGTPVGVACPECGRLVESEPDAHAPFDLAGRRIVFGYGWRIPAMAVIALIIAPVACVLFTHLVPRVTAFTFACSLVAVCFGLFLVPRWKDRIAVHHRLQADDLVCRLVRWGFPIWLLLSLFVYQDVLPAGNDFLVNLMVIAATLHTMLFFVIIERIAQWMAVDGVVQSARFAQSVSVVLVLTWIILLLAQLFIGLAPRGSSMVSQVAYVLILIFIAAVVVMWFTLVWLAKTALFNILHYHENREIEKRRLERLRAERAGMSPRL